MKEYKSGQFWIFISLDRELKYQAGCVNSDHQAALVVTAILEVRKFNFIDVK